ncbi:MAG: phosphate ABC transporter permease subunit PstC, partial [Acidaminococcaceae bacterium]
MDSYNKRRQRLNQVMQYIFRGSASLLIVIIAALLVFIAQQGVATFSEVSVGEFFGSSVWRPDAGQFGALAFIWGSLLVTAGALLVGAPLGIAGAIFLAKVAPAWMRSILQPAVNLYLAIPSVVYGFIG